MSHSFGRQELDASSSDVELPDDVDSDMDTGVCGQPESGDVEDILLPDDVSMEVPTFLGSLLDVTKF